MKSRRSSIWNKPEFLLVIAMLITLTALVVFVLHAPVPHEDSSITGKELLDYRQSILAVIITAFGAWVGAGAAYYFGRESQRGMLDMKELSARERLQQILIKNTPPKEIDWVVKKDEKVTNILKRLRAKPDKWFIPIVNDNGSLETVIHEEAIWRYVADKKTEEGTLVDVEKYIRGMPELKNWAEGIYVEARLENSASYVDEKIRERKKEIYLAIIVDDMGKPTHYITTGDLRRILMQGG